MSDGITTTTSVFLSASIVLACILISGCGPSCEERGGQLRVAYWVPIKAGNSFINSPVYRCVGAKHD